MANNGDFQTFLITLSRHYAGNNFQRLRMLLYGFLSIIVLDDEKKNTALDLFNALDDSGFISITNVRLLLDIAEVTKRAKARVFIDDYMKQNQISNTAGSRLSKHRIALYNTLENVGKGDLKTVNAYYRLGEYNYDNIWDTVYHIENEKELNSQQKCEKFANCLSKVAQGILLETPYEPPAGSAPVKVPAQTTTTQTPAQTIAQTPAHTTQASAQTTAQALATTQNPGPDHWKKIVAISCIVLVFVFAILAIVLHENIPALIGNNIVVFCSIAGFIIVVYKMAAEKNKKIKKETKNTTDDST